MQLTAPDLCHNLEVRRVKKKSGKREGGTTSPTEDEIIWEAYSLCCQQALSLLIFCWDGELPSQLEQLILSTRKNSNQPEKRGEV